MTSRRLLGAVGAVLILPATLAAQNVVSARAGLIHHSDGRVLLDEKPIVHKVAQFQDVKENEYLRTEQGRAEVLLTPGIFLRLGEESRIQMVSSRLSDVRLRLLAGAAVIEADELDKANSVTVLIGETEVHLERSGLYRFDVEEGEAPILRVFTGEATVAGPGGEFRVKSKKEIELAGDFQIRKFDPEGTDALDRWSRRRANYLAMANLSASRLAYNRGLSFSTSRWFWNPYYGMFTFLPVDGVCRSPYGFGFYSPRAAYIVYNPPPTYSPSPMDARGPSYNSSYGYTTVPHTSAGTSGVVASSPSSPVNQGGEATVSRGGDTGGGGARR